MNVHFVDVYRAIGRNFHAERCLDLAARHAARGIVWELLPYTIYGPGYDRAIHWELKGAVARLKAGEIHGAHYHLREAARCMPATWPTVHRPADGTPDLTQGSQPLFETAHLAAPGPIEAVVYNQAAATTLVRCFIYREDTSIASGRPPQNIPAAADAPAAWLDLRGAAEARTCGAIVVSDPKQIRPGQAVEDHRWAQAARKVAATACSGRVWAAMRTRSDAIAMLLDAPLRATGTLHRRVVAAATGQLRQPAAHTMPPAAAGETPTAVPAPDPQPTAGPHRGPR